MRTKKIELLYTVGKTIITPPAKREVARKDAWVDELKKEALSDEKPVMVKLTYEVFNPEIQRMSRFFNGVCVLYFAIQNMEMLEGTPPNAILQQYREELLDEMLGYDYKTVNKVIRTRRSTTEFKGVQAWHTFLTTLEETIFDSHGYFFPDSGEFWELARLHGHDQAQGISVKKLQAKLRSKQ